MKKLIAFGFDDWWHLYLDGVSVWSGHSISTGTLIQFMKKHDISASDYLEVEAKGVDVDEMYDSGQCPDNLSSLKEKI